ncbi:glycosyltransferase family 2 protein [Legionella bononiensis]|uniref:Glycosyltransferase family 2 protein n=1 Tax=Legionella bononiensis TaxID=2793102 RepID=A0ABS1W7Y9_9GAMM|nr:glycosyltransferase family 2 protein [Legionella bononiensis]MBL7480011.1 glycosyltransferase family 2 protein [Legionella bononiensis]MBL7525475.1 glycosyltransferase family 2 protein [Legionella bononiensis]MBL7561658.1 glycosyltransferase family 2 protein [Legionella bononiensis]
MVERLVTVVIVNYNAGEMLVRCIEQILAGTILPQIIISDNASTDCSLDMVEQRFSKCTNLLIHKNKKNSGFSAANNAVFADIKTPFILYLNPDCFIEKDTIQHLLDTMNEYPNAGIVGCLVTNMNGTEQVGCRGLTPTPARVLNQMLRLYKVFPNNPKYKGYLLSNEEIPKHPIQVELISGSCMFVRKEALTVVGLLDDNYFLYCEDYDWFYRFIQSKWDIIFTPSTKVAHIKSFSTKQIPLKILVYKAKGMWRYYNKFFKKNESMFTCVMVRTGIILRLVLLSFVVLCKKIISNIKVIIKYSNNETN